MPPHYKLTGNANRSLSDVIMTSLWHREAE